MNRALKYCNLRAKSLGGYVDLGTSFQVITFREFQRAFQFELLGTFQIVESNPSAPNQERENKQRIEDKQGNEVHLLI